MTIEGTHGDGPDRGTILFEEEIDRSATTMSSYSCLMTLVLRQQFIATTAMNSLDACALLLMR